MSAKVILGYVFHFHDLLKMIERVYTVGEEDVMAIEDREKENIDDGGSDGDSDEKESKS